MAKAAGYAITVKGVINVATVSPTQRAAKVNGIVLVFGRMVMDRVSDDEINSIWEARPFSADRGVDPGSHRTNGANVKTTRLDHTDACPFCGKKLDAVTAGPDNAEATPDPNDVTICIQCGGVLIFDEQLHVRTPTPDELAEVMADPGAAEMIQRIAAFNHDKRT